MSAPPDARKPPGVWAVVVARAGTALIDVCAFWLSATTLTDLARRAGIDPMQAWMWPVIVDGMIVVATVAIVALAQHGPRATMYPWALLIAGALVSVTANCLHALVATDSDLPPVLSASVAAVPPLVLLAATHLTVQLGRHLTRTTPAPAAAAAAKAVPAVHSATRQPHRLLSTEPSARGVAAPGAGPGNAENTPGPDSGTPSTAVPAVTARSVDEGLDAGDVGRRAVPVHHERDSTGGAPAGTPRAAAGSDARDQAASLAEEGLSNRAIAARLGVHPSTVGRWLTSPATLPPVEQYRPAPSDSPEPDVDSDTPDRKEPQP